MIYWLLAAVNHFNLNQTNQMVDTATNGTVRTAYSGGSS